MNHFPIIFAILGDLFIFYENKASRQLPPFWEAAMQFAAPRKS